MFGFIKEFDINDGILVKYRGIHKKILLPDCVTEIGYSAFDGNTEIKSVTVPGTVKIISCRAFADCKNLETVVLGEGVEVIESNVFTGCEKLRKVTYPDSIKSYQGWTFYGTRLNTPVMNASGTILVFCPECVSAKEWYVPDTVRTISRQAFIEHKALETLHLPEGLEVIENMAFIRCGFREIIIPDSVLEIGESAFRDCEQLETVIILNPNTKVSANAFSGCKGIKEIRYANITDSDKLFHLRGEPFLIRHLEDSANLHHDVTQKFKFLADRCAEGEPEAMYEMAVFFEGYAQEKNASAFYYRAANYWRYRAYCSGNAEAEDWFRHFFTEHPGEHLESVLSENSECQFDFYSFSIPGKMLNDLGFAFFDSKREYEIKQFEDDGLIEASSFSGYESADKDGFGAEYNYEWWFLDENMKLIPGVRSLTAEIRERNDSFFQKERNKAIEIIQKRKEQTK